LTRPFTDRVELLTVLLYVSNYYVGYDDANPPYLNLDIFLNARRTQIREALSRVAEANHRKLSLKTRHLKLMVDMLSDFPEAHKGNIVGLSDKSIAWHRQIEQDIMQRRVGNLGLTTATALPPAYLPLPVEPNIKFLATVREILEEGIYMQHCIASYATQAVQGRAYLFHVEYAGEEASVMLDGAGRVVQSYGPRNQVNKASRWAEQALKQWGRALEMPQAPGAPDNYADFDDYLEPADLPF
jgi:hypothetical protein